MDVLDRLKRAACGLLERAPRWISLPLLVLWRGVVRWLDAAAPTLGASIAFYTVFALAPLLIVTIAVAALVFGEDAARGQIVQEIEGLIGTRAAEAIETMILSSSVDSRGPLATALGLVTILVGATGVFAELRRALDRLADPRGTGPAFTSLLRMRLVGLALLLGLGFLVIASLVLSAVLAAFAGYLSNVIPSMQFAFAGLDVASSTLVLSLAFAGLLRWVPDQPPSRRGVWIGAISAAALFSVGKTLIGMYLGRASVTSSFGAAASFAVILLWTWYSSQILLFGAAVGLGYDDVTGNTGPRPSAVAATEGPHPPPS